MKSGFTRVYDVNQWVYGSGIGSTPASTRKYRRFLAEFLRTHNIRSVVDFGCGDWQSSRLIDWTGIDYLGLDVVESVIETNQKRFGSKSIRFEPTRWPLESLPQADLLIAKDVLQHWPDADIHKFRPLMSTFRYALITNCVELRGETKHRDIETADFRPLDLARPPFSWPLTKAFEYTGRGGRLWFLPATWRKMVYLHTNNAV